MLGSLRACGARMRAVSVLACAASAAAVLAWTAAADGQGRQGGTVTMLFASDVDSIDPGMTYSNTGQMLAIATQRSLLTYAPGDVSAPLPDLAAAAPVVSPDGLTVTVALKPGIRFSPPVSREVTSRDVKYAIERGFFRSVRTPYAQLYFAGITGARPDVAQGTTIPGIETPDDRTIVFHLDRPNAGTLIAAMVMTLTAPVPAEYAAPFDAQPRSTYGTHQVATGPYMIRNDAQGDLVGYRPGRRIDIVRNPNWDPATDFRPARLDAIAIRSGNTNFVQASRRILRGSSMLSGDIFVPVNELRTEFRSRRDQFAIAPAGSIQFMPLNTKLAPFDDINVRRAVVAGFDRVGFRRIAGGPLTGDIATHFIPPTVPGFAEAGGRAGPGVDFVSDLDGSRALAGRYLRRAGFPSGRYTGRRPINVLTAKDTTGRRVGRFVAAQLRRLGFRVRVRALDFNAMFARCGDPRARVHACPLFGWIRDFPDAQSVLDPLFNGRNILPEANNNMAQLDVPAVSAAIDAARALADPGQRARAWAAVDRRITAQAPGVPLVWGRFVSVRSADTLGVINQALATWDLSHSALR